MRLTRDSFFLDAWDNAATNNRSKLVFARGPRVLAPSNGACFVVQHRLRVRRSVAVVSRQIIVESDDGARLPPFLFTLLGLQR